MPIQQTTPDKAKEILDKDKEAVYLDVRSVPEFTEGHAKGAINIPLIHLTDGEMIPNPDFPKVAEAVLDKEKTTVVGCKMGGRSQKSCEILERIGFKKLFNIQGGFGGSPDQPGWKDLGLPVSRDNGEGVSYESLVKKIK
ncbi:MAG: rhodanese-like domain-containing protein [Deltaproteobacteria bacterium]|nr:rhodanese-like domain-containing protein [Deltaproteobacteria bacterium]MBI4373783.1 rhodanese-like domain-containing protein [Deltaproteobacteria bacterium]